MDKFQEALKLSEEVKDLSAKARDLVEEFKPSVLSNGVAPENKMHWALCKLADDLRNVAITYDNADIFYGYRG